MSGGTVALLGRVGIDRAGRPATARPLPGRRAELVFAYLAAEHRRAVSRDELADALWPDLLPDSWAPALRGVVTEVRRFLEDAGWDAGEVLASAGGGYQLRLPEGATTDLDEARAAEEAARARLSGGEAAEAATAAQRAADLARLPFLPQHEGEWVDAMRQELAALHARALELQARAHAAAGDHRAAAAAAERLVRTEPFSEAAHRLRIGVLGAAGDGAGAKAAFEHCRAVLTGELGVEPSKQTAEVLREALERVGPAERPPAAAPLSVLVVEDHDFQRRTAVQLLRRLGVATIGEAADGRAALAAIAASGPPDVIVCDLEMPGMDGVEFIREVAERDLASALIVCSAMESRVVGAVEALAEGYGLRLLGAVEKPLTARRLDELLRAYRREPTPPAGTPVAGADLKRLDVRFRPVVDLGIGMMSGAVAVPGLESAGGWVAVDDGANGFTERVLDRIGRISVEVTVRLPGTLMRDLGLADRLAACRADPRRIVCAVEEHALRREASALLALTRLRLKGFGVAVENHGAEDLPARLPLTIVRLAASLLTRPAELEQALERVRSLGLACVATGCDSADDLDLLLELGCSHAEGAFIGPAMPAAELERWTPPLAGGTA